MSKTIRVAMKVTQISECWCEVEVTDKQYEDYCNNLAEPKDFLNPEDIEKVYQESGQFSLDFCEEETEILWDDHSL